MEFIFAEKIKQKYYDRVFEMLCDADKDFIPPLSYRESTTQSDLCAKDDSDSKVLPISYFEKIKGQASIIASENEKIVGFMSIIEDHKLFLGDKEYNCCYLSTLIVDKAERGKHISVRLYDNLLARYSDKNIITRTWSTNSAHIGLLSKLGFDELHRIKDDRGEGIETINFGKLI